MIDGIDYFPKREKHKKTIDTEWDDLKKVKLSQKPRKNKVRESQSEGKEGDSPK